MGAPNRQSCSRLAVIMAGGSGERFWPLSRPDRPKQMLRLTRPDKTMLDEAVERVAELVGLDSVWISTGAPLRKAVIESGVVAPDHVLAEPSRRNTLGAILWVAANAHVRLGPETTIAFLTADHLIGEPDAFRESCASALDLAATEPVFVTLGVEPTRPETGYGYLELGAAFAEGRRVVRFREKPNLQTAQAFVESGRYAWNSGMFFFRPSTLALELLEANPEIWQTYREMLAAIESHNPGAAQAAFELLPSVSFDIEVMERTRRAVCLSAQFPWDDIGAWDAMARSHPLDANGNVVQGGATLIETHDSIVIHEDGMPPVGIYGVRDLIVVVSKDGILIVPKDQAQEVRQITRKLSRES